MATNLITKILRELPKRYKSKIHLHMPSFVSSHKPVKRTYATAAAKSNNEMLRGLQVMINSREMIKPSFPTTSRHVNSVVQLSILDQLQPSFHIPFIFFYKNVNDGLDPSKRSIMLKKSLSETLARFYPLAGRVEGNVSIDCNDQGVEFCEAYVSDSLSEVIEDPNYEEIRELLPFQAKPRHKNLVLGVQVNHFSCGGTAIGVCVSHKITDGWGSVEFIRAWSDKTSTQGMVGCTQPKFNAASFFPQLPELSNVCAEEDAKVSKEKIVSKRLIFDKKKLDELKLQVKSKINKPSGVEVVSASIWKHMMRRIPVISTAVHAVNLRTRTVPSIPKDCFGNFVLLTSSASLVNGGEREDAELINEVRKGIGKLDNEYLLRLLKSRERVSELEKERDNINHGEEKCCFTSLCKFPLYEVEFGMGKPVWACHVTPPAKNLVALWNTKCGQGIEAWVQMFEDDMQAFQHDLGPILV